MTAPLIDPFDLDIKHLDWPGGQHVGVRSGVSVTHNPSGITVTVEVDRSQRRNRDIAIDAILGALTSPHYR